MKTLYSIEDKVLDELDQICRKPDWSPSDVEMIYKMVDIVKDIETVDAMKQAGYSQTNAYTYPESRYSERRGRDSMGRFTSRDNSYYAGHDGSMIEMLRDKMHNASTEAERENYRRVIDQLER